MAAPSGENTEAAAPAGPGLHAGLRARHLIMMSLGSAIGAGLFVGSGKGIAAAGPAVLIAYAVAGLVVIAVMRMLGEMVAADPNPGAFSYYAGRALGPGAGFAVGWLWWVQLCLVVAAEAVAAAAILNGLLPGGPPVWVWALVFMVALTGLNLSGVRGFGEFEFWFSLIKVVFVGLFLVVGVGFLLGWTSAPSPGVSNLSDFAPHGISGVVAALLVVAFAFGGIEIVAVAAAETRDPERTVGRAIRATVWRILIFYVGSVAVILLALPWNDPAVAAKPFVAVLDAAGLPAVGTTLGAVIVIALLSSLNANVYGSSRMLYSLAERGMAPAAAGRANSSGVPVLAVLASSLIGFLAVPATYLWGSEVLDRLLAVVGSTLIVTWLATVASQIVLRRRAERDGTRLPLRMWAYPYLSWAVLVVLLGIVVLAVLNDDVRDQVLSTAVVVLVLWGFGTLHARRQARRASLER
ncbi:amino acid permease [Tsukamurella spumae]|uniref:Amino acid permease n=1 Tax=Tsukamurella spumae TaxID=44753 RepID=A0A846XA31_9ACTN|nr:amino acid permease [Tsukamurella spumae]NKY20530.1 amino acid permease [Tsukamurella spumae]